MYKKIKATYNSERREYITILLGRKNQFEAVPNFQSDEEQFTATKVKAHALQQYM